MSIAILIASAILDGQSHEKPITALNEKSCNLITDVALPVKRSFGVVDLWKIRGLKRKFSINTKHI